MHIEIKIENKLVEIALVKGIKIIDSATFPEENNLSEKLLPAIDGLLKKNKLAPRGIKDVKVETDTPGSFTTSRIAKTVGKVWEWASLRITN